MQRLDDIAPAEVRAIWGLLSAIPDPEVPVLTITDLGMVRSVARHGDGWVIGFTPTYSGCPATEHLLGEILAQADAFDALRPAFVLSGSTRENELLHRVLARFPGAPVLTGGRETEWALLARQVYVDPGKLPLAIVADRSLHAIYAASGYNVGLASMLVKIAKNA